MWIFTKYGFFSAVCARQGDGKHGQPVDPDRVMVRARVRKHLEDLAERFPEPLGDCEILDSAGTDYAFRLFVPKPAWARVLSGLAEELDYDNFKSEVARHQGQEGTDYEHSLHDVWSVMHKLQKRNRAEPAPSRSADSAEATRPTYRFKNDAVPNYETLVRQRFNLKSPFRSTVPLLAYWADAERRLTMLGNAIGAPLSGGATLTFEFMVSPARGRGNASHTDLMIQCPGAAVAVEAKYTEQDHDPVSNWLQDAPSENKVLVLEGWLEMINRAAGCSLVPNDVLEISYQLIHRTASACKPATERRAIVYHYFDPVGDRRDYYRKQLRELSARIAAPDAAPLFLYMTTLSKSEEYARLCREWAATTPRPDLSDSVRRLLAERNVASFGDPVVERF